MSTTLEKLTFTVLLLDKLSGPSAGVCKSLQKVQQQSRLAFQSIGKGSVTIMAAAAGLTSITGPAREMNKALGEVASLGVAKSELETLEKACSSFVMKFGGDAADVVRSAYDIQSAIPGLGEGALAAFTVNSALLAKATKSNEAEMTAYIGTMYSIFEKDAKRIGQAEWVEQLTGKTAKAVEMFKTTGPAMKQAFESFGSIGAVMNVQMEDQVAALGVLQGKMGAANAGTGLKSFYTKLGNAQNSLKLNFTGSDGKLLPVYEIISKIENKLGKMSDVNKVKALTDAFGESGAAAVMNMMGKTEQLKTSINDLSEISGAKPAENMAEKMIDPLGQFQATLKVVRTTLGQSILPLVDSGLQALSAVLRTFKWMLDNIPGLQLIFALLAGAIGGLTAVWGAFMIVSGVGRFFKAWYKELRLVYRFLRMNISATKLYAAWMKISAAAQWLWAKATGAATWAAQTFTWANIRMAGALVWQNTLMIAQKVGMLIYAGALWLLNAALLPAIAAVWAFTAALLANPITWIVLGIVALIAAVAALIYWWDDLAAVAVGCWDAIVGAAAWCWEKLKAFFSGFGEWLLALLGPVGWIVLAFLKWDVIKDIAAGVWNFVVDGFTWLWERIRAIGTAIGDFFGWIWDGVAGGIRAALDSVLGVIDTVTGAIGNFWNWITGGGSVEVRDMRENEPVMAQATAQRNNPDVPAGGVRSSVSNRTTNYGGVTINASRPLTPGELEDWAALQA